MKKEEYDAIIIGAGPAGLLLGKELSKKHSILILEKKKIGETNKSWVTYEDRWKKQKYPETLIENRFKEWFMQTKFNENVNEIVFKDKFICFNEQKFLKYLAKVIKENKGVILENTSFKNLELKRGRVIINNRFESRLLIDCSGIDSKLVKKHNLIKTPVYINCYGCIAKFNSLNNHNFYCNYKNRGDKIYRNFGLTKVGHKKGFLIYLEYSDKMINPSTLRNKFRKSQKKFDIPKNSVLDYKIASYPTGILRKRSMNNIFFFGDAGLYSPSFIGMGFNEILRQHLSIAKHLSQCIKNNEFSENELKLPDNIAQDVNNLFFQVFGIIYNHMPPELLFAVFDAIKAQPKKDLKRIFRNDITDKEITCVFRKILRSVDMSLVISSIPKNRLIPIIKIFLELPEKILTEEIHNLLFKHHKIRIKDMYS